MLHNGDKKALGEILRALPFPGKRGDLRYKTGVVPGVGVEPTRLAAADLKYVAHGTQLY